MSDRPRYNVSAKDFTWTIFWFSLIGLLPQLTTILKEPLHYVFFLLYSIFSCVFVCVVAKQGSVRDAIPAAGYLGCAIVGGAFLLFERLQELNASFFGMLPAVAFVGSVWFVLYSSAESSALESAVLRRCGLPCKKLGISVSFMLKAPIGLCFVLADVTWLLFGTQNKMGLLVLLLCIALAHVVARRIFIILDGRRRKMFAH